MSNEWKEHTITPFKFYCQHVLPLVYDQSLSFYEVLCKLQLKLNEIIKTQNDLQDAFQNLLVWVDTQLEKYSKDQLNEWLTDGTLEQLINEVLFKSKIGWYPNVQAMINDTTLDVTNACITLGYYTPNDGGGGTYQIVEKTNQTNIGNNVYLSNGLVANLIEENGTINLAQYGIKPYDPEQPLIINDTTPILQYAINTLASKKGGIVKIPTGQYAFKGSVILRPHVTVQGTISTTVDARTGTELYFMPSTMSNFMVLDPNDKQYGYIFDVHLKDLSMYGNEFTDTHLKMDCLARSSINNVTTKYGKTGLYLNFGMTNKFEKMRILYPSYYGFFMDNIQVPTTTQVMSDTYIGNSGSFPNARPIYITRKSCYDIVFNNCIFESMPQPSVISSQNKVTFNGFFNEDIPTTTPRPTFEIGLLRSEVGIAGSTTIDNTQPVTTYVSRGQVTFNDSKIQGSNTQNVVLTSGLNCVNIQQIDNVSFNNCEIVGFNKLYSLVTPTYMTDKINFLNCVFDNVSNNAGNNYYKDTQFINCNNINSNQSQNDLTQVIQARPSCSNVLNTVGWYVFGEITDSTVEGASLLVMLNTKYANTPSQSTVVCISSNTTNGNIVKLSSNGKTPIDAIRVVKQSGLSSLYLEFHYNVSVANDIRVVAMPLFNEASKMRIYGSTFQDTDTGPTVVTTLNL